MVISSLLVGIALVAICALIGPWLFAKVTLSVQEQTECFLMKFGRLQKTFRAPGLHFVPEKLFPWTHLISISKQIEYKIFKGIQVNDRFGTTVVVDLWIEFRISDPYKALFSVENWEEVLQSVIVHSTGSILSSQTVDEILKHRMELSEKLRESIAHETERWGIALKGAMVQNIGLLPEISKQFFSSVAARIERTTALVEEEGRLKVAKLEVETARRVAVLNGLVRSQRPLALGKFYQGLSVDPTLQQKFDEYWDLVNMNPQKTVTFSGFSDSPINVIEATKAMESVLSH